MIFIDEIDSLAPACGDGLREPAVTERAVNSTLAEIDRLEDLQGVIAMSATNRPNLLDPARTTLRAAYQTHAIAISPREFLRATRSNFLDD